MSSNPTVARLSAATRLTLSNAVRAVPLIQSLIAADPPSSHPAPAHHSSLPAPQGAPPRQKLQNEPTDVVTISPMSPISPIPPTSAIAAHHGAPQSAPRQNEPTAPAPQSAPAHRCAPSPQNPQNEATCLSGSPHPTAHQGAPQFAPAQIKPTAPPPLSTQDSALTTLPLSPQQLAALRLLLHGQRPTAVAAQLNIDRHTLLRWRRSDPFNAELQRIHTLAATNALANERRSLSSI
jgi:hypothetical protein